MLSISSRTASASGIRAYLEGERDGASRGPEDYYPRAATRGPVAGERRRQLRLRVEVSGQAFDHLAAGFHPDRVVRRWCSVPASNIAGLGYDLLGAEVGVGGVGHR